MMKVLNKMKAIRKDMRDNKGFTLVELIVVIVILAVLIGVSVSGYSKYIGQSKMNTDKNNAETVRAAIINAQAAEGVYEYLIGTGATVPTVTINNTGVTGINATSGTVFEKAIAKSVDLTTLKTQTKDGVITLTVTLQTDDAGKADGSVNVAITSTGYPAGFIGSAAAGGATPPAGGGK